MVLDARAMGWAADNEIDTKKLKAAGIPIYGKWYFPDLPAGVPLVNLETGEIRVFPPGMWAGEIIWVPRNDLRKARLGPYAALSEDGPAQPPAEQPDAPSATPPAGPARIAEEIPPGIHLPGPSIFPLIVALGLSITLLAPVVGPPLGEGGLVVRGLLMLLGLIYCLVGGIGWALESGAEHGEEETVAGPASAARE